MLAVWLPELPFQIARLQEPWLAGRPLGFRNPEAGRTPRLWMVDRVARGVGLEAGLPVDVALHQDPGLVVLDPVPATWMDARAVLARQLLAFSPQGRLGRFGEGFLDLRGTERLHGPALDAAERIRRELRGSVGWEAHGGLSRSLTASRLAARAEDQVRLVASRTEAPFLAPFSLPSLPALEARSRERLAHFGLHRIAEVQPLDVDALGRLIPAAAAYQVLRQAKGEDEERLPALEVDRRSESVRRLLQPPAHKHELGLAAWVWGLVWDWRLEGRHLHRVQLAWWGGDDAHHVLKAARTPGDLWRWAQELELRFLADASRRVLIQRLELEAWLGPEPSCAALLLDDATRKRLALEATALRLQRRFGRPMLRMGA